MIICVVSRAVWSDDWAFKVNSTVRQIDNANLQLQNETIFDDQQVFDIVVENGKTVEAFIWDSQTGGFMLLDPIRELRCQVSREALVRLTAEMQFRAEKMPKIVRDALAPNFRIRWDEAQHQLTMTNPRIVYSAKLSTPPAKEIVVAYRQFSDAASRLNASRPGALPPNARLSLNREIANKLKIPDLVTVSLEMQEGRLTKLESCHEFVWKFSAKDEEQMEFLTAWSKGFSEVDLPEFRQRPKE